MIKRRALLAAPLLGLTAPARAQNWPDRTVRFLVPFAPGGNTDLVGRLSAQWMTQALGVSVVVENRGGAGGIVGSDAVAKAAPDGSLFLVGSIGSISVAPALERLPYDPQVDLAPVSLLSTNALVLLGRKALPFGSTQDVVAAAKAAPERLTYGSSGIGGLMHVSMLVLEVLAAAKFTHVPFRSGSQAAQSLTSGDIDLMFANMSDALPLVQGGVARAFAVSTAQRSAQMPDVPTMQELGFAGFDVVSWNALFAPAATPRPVVEKLSETARRMVADPDIQRRMAGFGSVAAANTPAEFAAQIRAETAMWGDILKRAGLARPS